MTEQQINESRKAFEAKYPWNFERHESGRYLDRFVEERWRYWLSACEAFMKETFIAPVDGLYQVTNGKIELIKEAEK